MTAHPTATVLEPRPPRSRRAPRAVLWAALVGLLLVAQTLLVMLTLNYEEARAQERSDDIAAAAVTELRQRAMSLLHAVQSLPSKPGSASQADAWAQWSARAADVLRDQHALGRLERRDAQLRILEADDSPYRDPLFRRWPRAELDLETDATCAAARLTGTPRFSRSHFVPAGNGTGQEVMELCLPLTQAGHLLGYQVATVVLSAWLDELRVPGQVQTHELSFVEPDGTRLARAGTVRGAGIYTADRLLDLPGAPMQLRVDAVERRPSLIPNLATALVLGLSMGLFCVVVLLVRDGRRRARAEMRLAEALAFRKAMEDSLSTGLRARDLAGRIVYVNPAFCAMVGYAAEVLMRAEVPPYWPAEQLQDYQRRQAERLAASLVSTPVAAPGATPGGAAASPAREGFETEFVRHSGERFPVMIYEAPLVDGQGQHTGWMSAVLDLSAQRRVEDLSRQQQERLQATARLVSIGEMASLLSHELNQPLSAIASYATGSLNLLQANTGPPDGPDPDTPAMLRHAMARIAEQAERAGRVIKSVHDVVRRRDQAHELVGADQLLASVLPLVRLQARKSGTRIEVLLAQPVPRVKVDRTMVEQVLLNLARNGIQAMEGATPLAQRVLTLRVDVVGGTGHGDADSGVSARRWVAFEFTDRGPGITPEVAQRLFTPFFTTKGEGMGLGLSLCRTVVEQHGGAIDFENLGANADGTGGGLVFRFTLPLAAARPAARAGLGLADTAGP